MGNIHRKLRAIGQPLVRKFTFSRAALIRGPRDLTISSLEIEVGGEDKLLLSAHPCLVCVTTTARGRKIVSFAFYARVIANKLRIPGKGASKEKAMRLCMQHRHILQLQERRGNTPHHASGMSAGASRAI